MENAFAKLHPKIQEAIFRENWQTLRPLQRDAVHAVFDTNADLILAAATASGKTEAAFLPILSKIANEPEGGVKALYIGPLKALINDQFQRLERLCELAQIPVHRWHGDVSRMEKERLRTTPGGVLLITPESMESGFVNFDRHLAKIYHSLQFVVIDELHAFLDNVRGAHLRSLLARLCIAAAVRPRLVGLSATLGDFGAAQSFLCQDDPTSVLILEDVTQQKEKRIALKAFFDEGEEMDHKEGLRKGGLNDVAADLALRFRSDANLIFCNSRSHTELLADKLRQMEVREHWPRNPFLMHHGSLSKEIREDAEAKLKSGQPVTALCTSTLEMGIDIGSVKAIGQVGPPWTVASLVQRLGRSGRGEGQAQILRLYTLDWPVTPASSLADRFYPKLTRGIAMVELFREKWLEPAEGERFHFSTAIHQLLSILRQTGGITALVLHDRLCLRGAFRRLDKVRFAALLRGLAGHKLIEQIPTAELILAPAGERIVESRDFYAAFASSIEYNIEFDGKSIGMLPVDSIPAEGEFMLLSGRRWKVEAVNHEAKRVLVTPAKGWKKLAFAGGGGLLHDRVMAKMREVLAEDDSYPYLHENAVVMLRQARESFANASLGKTNTVSTLQGMEWFPWAGTRVLRTLELCAKVDGITVERDEICLIYKQVSISDFNAHVKRIAEEKFETEVLMTKATVIFRDRFDEYVAPGLLKEAYANEVLDVVGAQQSAMKLMGI